MEIYYQYMRPRRGFGRHAKFSDSGAEMIADVRPNADDAAAVVVRNPCTTAVQCVPEVSEHEANTTAVIYASKAMSHIEGGWPKDVDPTEAEHTIRYRRKVEKDEDFIRTLAALGAVAESAIKANNAVDVHEDYFAGLAADHASEPPSAATVTALRDPAGARGSGNGGGGGGGAARPANCVCWHPDGASKVVVAYADLAFQRQPPGMSLSSYVFDVASPNAPECELAAASQLVVARYNLKDASLIGAGQYNGQFTIFDTRKGAAPADATPMDACHRDPVYDVAWLQSKTGSEAMTASTDGRVLWWDIRRLAEPLESLPLRDKLAAGDALLGAVALEYDPAAGPAKFMVGTEQGTVLACNRKAKNPADRVGASYAGHYGPVYGLHRNPFAVKYFMTIGDWAARIWNEDLRSPFLVGRYSPAYVTGGGWSPVRPGVYFTTARDGALSVWDLAHRQSEPTLTVRVTDRALTSFAAQAGGGVLAAGAADGAVHVLRLSAGLSEAAPDEKQGIVAMLERETLREKNLEKAAKEARVKARREAARAADGADATPSRDLEALEDAFFAATGVTDGARIRGLGGGSSGASGGGGGGGGAGNSSSSSGGGGGLSGDAAAAGDAAPTVDASGSSSISSSKARSGGIADG